MEIRRGEARTASPKVYRGEIRAMSFDRSHWVAEPPQSLVAVNGDDHTAGTVRYITMFVFTARLAGCRAPLVRR